MIKKIFVFIFIPLLLTIFGEFILKSTINSLSQTAPPRHHQIFFSKKLCELEHKQMSVIETKLICVFSDMELFLYQPKIILGILCITLGGILWVVAMSKFELSFLYPFLSLNYVGIIVGAHFFLHESVSLYRYLSVVLIILGLLFISRSPYSENQKDKKP